VPTEAPAIGAHSREVLVELGYAETEINDLLQSGSIAQGEA
jgi:crotonobetainyl-CoA:carnitine CoA-transferase CaiB-like acyl-CoA transferase